MGHTKFLRCFAILAQRQEHRTQGRMTLGNRWRQRYGSCELLLRLRQPAILCRRYAGRHSLACCRDRAVLLCSGWL